MKGYTFPAIVGILVKPLKVANKTGIQLIGHHPKPLESNAQHAKHPTIKNNELHTCRPVMPQIMFSERGRSFLLRACYAQAAHSHYKTPQIKGVVCYCNISQL